jgi:CubicO group peptidase (beta-lactamase class C family)
VRIPATDISNEGGSVLETTSGGGWDDVVAILEDAIRPGGVAPAAALLVGRGDQIVFEQAFGTAGPPGREHPCDFDTIFDLASLTKPLVTVFLVLDLIARGRLSFDTHVASVLPGFAGAGDDRRARVSIRDLLRHDAGLPAYERYFEQFEVLSSSPSTARRRMHDLAIGQPLERDPRSGSVYSDIGFLVLGALVERIAGDRLDVLARERIFGPLDVETATFVETVIGPEPAFAARCARTGVCDWRRAEIHGVVQDEICHAMGGIGGHAGLFATARDVHALLSEWEAASRGHGAVLDRRLVAHAWNRVAAGAGAAPSTWTLGWDTPTPGLSSAGTRVSSIAVGHLGYTGTSMWVDPSRGVHVVLLTNRIAFGRSSEGIKALRPRLHDAVFAAL